MWSGTITRAQLHDSISRLQELDRIPEKPRENVFSLKMNATQSLTRERENEIVSNLAFLSAVSDNYRDVMAVCIEEDRDGRGATVRLASNTGDLAEVTSGFEVLATILKKAAGRGWSKFDLFTVRRSNFCYSKSKSRGYRDPLSAYYYFGF